MFKDKIKSMIKENGEKSNKRQIENIVFLIIILIVVVVAINRIWSKEDNKDKINDNDDKVLAQTIDENLKDTQKNQNSSNYYNLQESLETILETMEGVGKVKVLINYSETSSVVAMYNETVTESSTQEKDTSGGTRNVTEVDTQKEIAYSEQSGNSTPITEKVIMPTIEGAIITAQGAENATVKANIVSAVEAVTGLATHKIQVFKMENVE
ncbi:MAG: hypothetical protein HFJ49_02525 [Clostridia bacterium]|nr:hypothetical protein [Clostridia bacterium]